MTLRSKRAVICTFTLLACASTSRAQEGRPYVGGTFIVSQLKLGTIGSGSTGYSNTEIRHVASEPDHRGGRVDQYATGRWS